MLPFRSFSCLFFRPCFFLSLSLSLSPSPLSISDLSMFSLSLSLFSLCSLCSLSVLSLFSLCSLSVLSLHSLLSLLSLSLFSLSISLSSLSLYLSSLSLSLSSLSIYICVSLYSHSLSLSLASLSLSLSLSSSLSIFCASSAHVSRPYRGFGVLIWRLCGHVEFIVRKMFPAQRVPPPKHNQNLLALLKCHIEETHGRIPKNKGLRETSPDHTAP